MTEQGPERAGTSRTRLVLEGTALLDRFSAAELASMVRHLREITEMTDRHRDRLRS